MKIDSLHISTNLKIISMILIFPLLASSCLREEADNHPKVPNRTLLFYMAGDGSIEGEIQEKTDALAAAWNVPEGNRLLVYQNRGKDYTPRLLEIGKGKADVLEDYTDRKTTFGQDLSRAINDMVRFCPGSDYGLIVFSHSNGWLPSGNYGGGAGTRTVATDGSMDFELRDFAHTIPDGQFRFIIFESCQMAGIEVAYELRSKTGLILASSAEIVSPGFTPVYGRMLERLYKETPELTEFANDYYEYCNKQTGDLRSATVNVISTAGVAPFREFISRVEEENVEHWEWVERDKIQHFDRRKADHLFYDLESYIRSIGTQQDINRLAGLLAGAVLYKAATESFMPGTPYGFEVGEHCGLTIYIPSTKYPYLNEQRKLLLLFSEHQE